MSPEMQARWNQLTQAEQDKVLEAHRDWNVRDEWWDSVYEAFRERCGELGIRVDAMYFSGFWSQGDGACFDGRVIDWELFLAHCGHPADSPAQAWFRAMKDDCYFTCAHSGYYYHEYSVAYDWDLAEEAELPYDPEHEHVQYHVLRVVKSKLDLDALAEKFSEAFRGLMRKLYRDLEAEYEYLTSEEAILESLDANDHLEEAIDEILAERDPEDAGPDIPETEASPPRDNPQTSNILRQSI